MSLRPSFVLALAVLASAPGRASQVVQSAGGGTILQVPPASTGRFARLLFSDGREQQLRLPVGVEVTGLADLASGWLASGTVADPGGARRIWLALGDRRGSRELLAPPATALAIQRRPEPLVEAGELVGLAWLEGAAAGGLGVRAAARSGSGWAAPEWVAKPGPGSQLSLDASVLADGSWLLVWSAFDGEDDEIVAARRSRGAWEKPERIAADNRVPDITPALTPTRDGALVAWSRYQGGSYALVRSAFDGQSWRELAGVERGGLYPLFRGEVAQPDLLFFDPRRAGWTVLELDERGAVVRRAEAAGPASDAPPVMVRDQDGVRLRASSGEEFTGRWRSPR